MVNSANKKGMLWYLCFCGCLNIMDILLKKMAVFNVSLTAVLFFRGMVGLALFFQPNLSKAMKLPLKTHLVVVLRILTSFFALFVWLIPLQHAQLTSATAVTLLCPIFACLLSCTFLNESLNSKKVIALLISLVGTCLILKPFNDHFNPSLLYSLLSALAWSSNIVLSKLITKEHCTKQLMFISNVYMILLSACLYPTWTPLSQHQWLLALPLLGCFAVLGNIRQWALLQATRFSSIGSLMPLEYSRLIFAAIIALVVYQEPLAVTTLIGGSVIVIANIFNQENEDSKNNPINTDTQSKLTV